MKEIKRLKVILHFWQVEGPLMKNVEIKSLEISSSFLDRDI